MPRANRRGSLRLVAVGQPARPLKSQIALLLAWSAYVLGYVAAVLALVSVLAPTRTAAEITGGVAGSCAGLALAVAGVDWWRGLQRRRRAARREVATPALTPVQPAPRRSGRFARGVSAGEPARGPHEPTRG
jgi:hypothetical protein